MREGGGQIVLLRRVPGPRPARALLSINTQDFAVHRPAAVATASSGIDAWPPIVALSAVALLLLGWLGWRHRRPDSSGPAAGG